VAVLLLALLAQTVSSIPTLSLTCDEQSHFAAGLWYWRKGNFQMVPETPPLIHLYATVPLLFTDINMPHGGFERTRSILAYAANLIRVNWDRLQTYLILTRLMIAAMSACFALCVWRWARTLYGKLAGLSALFFYCFSPNIVAHSSLFTTEIGCSFLMLVSAFALWRFVVWWETAEGAKWFAPLGRAAVLGFATGLALLAKMTSLCLFFLIGLIFLILGIQTVRRRRPVCKWMGMLAASAVALLVVVTLTVNAGYLFQGTGEEIGSYEFKSAFMQRVQRLLPRSTPVPLPYSYVDGFDRLRRDTEGRYLAFLRGRLSTKGWWYYYALAYLWKVPVPMLILLFAAVLMRLRHPCIPSVSDCVAPCAALVVFGVMSFLTDINIGLRYVLPAFAFIFVWTSPALSGMLRGRMMWRVAGVLLAASYAASALAIWPHQLSYFNCLAGGPANGYKLLVDSNIDWGQDLISLRRYMAKHGIPRVKIAYFGPLVDPDMYGVHHEHLPDGPTTGTIAISVSLLQGLPQIAVYRRDSWFTRPPRSFEWLKAFQPVGRAGYSILIFKITPDDLAAKGLKPVALRPASKGVQQ